MRRRRSGTTSVVAVLTCASALACTTVALAGEPTHSVARQWNEENLDAIRNDLARPTIHARNLYHVSIAMWDAWAAYDPDAKQVLHQEKLTAKDVQAARDEAISYAAYRVLFQRYATSPGAFITLLELNDRMAQLGYDTGVTTTVGDSPAALGNRIAATVLAYGLTDGANEANGYANQSYEPINEPLLPDFPGNPDLTEPNNWQPLALDFFVDQSGNLILGGYPDFLSPEWGEVDGFALLEEDRVAYERDGWTYYVFHDPGSPPWLRDNQPRGGTNYYKWGFEQVAIWSGHLDPTDGVMIDCSPASIGNAPLPEPEEFESFYNLAEGGDWGQGWDMNPATGQPYEPQIVPRGDYGRILAEFWADGPDSETPPGHWFTILNYVSDHPAIEKRIGGTGPIVDDLEWDVKAYLVLGGAMHDAAICAWGVKGWYDFIRPISAIRYMCDLGQCSDPTHDSYNPDGINLHPGLIEIVTEESSAPGERHEHLADHVGKIALYAWLGHDEIEEEETDTAGVGWMLAENWWPYQRPSFVTPPFAGYVSGHSTFSRAAAEVMTRLTGDPFFPGGMGEFFCPENEFLVFEDGPSMDVTLQWATYRDASDQCSLSRIWGGIHPGCDDIPGRHIGLIVGPDAWNYALTLYRGYEPCPGDFDGNRRVDINDFFALLQNWGDCPRGTNGCAGDCHPHRGYEWTWGDGKVDELDFINLLEQWGTCD
jgi:hypothetical protein